jgi:hypothetical protein
VLLRCCLVCASHKRGDRDDQLRAIEIGHFDAHHTDIACHAESCRSLLAIARRPSAATNCSMRASVHGAFATRRLPSRPFPA